MALVEWRHSGHRLFYVRAIVDAAAYRGLPVEVITHSAVAESNEWAVHLGDLPNLSVQILARDEFASRGLAKLLRRLRNSGLSVILPEVDRVLPIVFFAFLAGQLPKRVTVIAMRPPRWSSPRSCLQSFAKVVALGLLAATRNLRILLLEDPLSNDRTRVWRWPLGNASLRLDDPAAASPVGATLPPELRFLPDSCQVFSLIGAIDSRKHAPLILDGWALKPEREDCVLVIAGSLRPDVRQAIVDHQSVRRSDVVIIDRYLSSAEHAAVVDRSIALFVLFNGGLSSGTLLSAAQTGRWAITANGSRAAAVAAERGFGLAAELTPRGIDRCVDAAVRRQALPDPVVVAGCADFGDRVLGVAD